MGAGTVGLLATLALRLRGIEVTTFALSRKPYLNADLIETIGARYESTADVPILEGASATDRLISFSRPQASRPSSLRACKA